ncbi:disulfide bond formation protein B (plasmid) [Pelagibacterium nitratireducens]|jgi:disulfide bond formation protein DsbB|uniref:Disulfide bond formation protein B n=1 Tax=Pelagibacterium nitratireducens TaxID=1046114 RepID=A0ABZ2IBJ0_9HYPH|tara:strand:+ start:204 stop:662 length:459 start_codon:yes stop_codon:yes gene_type:complete
MNETKANISTQAVRGRDLWAFMFVAWVMALAASLGALFIGEVMGQTPCILCWYQRNFMFSLAFVLGLACFKAEPGAAKYGLVLAVPGLVTAGWHVLLFYGVVSEAIAPCTQGISCTDAEMTIRGIPLPLLSLLTFTVIAALMMRIALLKENS